jgi:hypothetical protein
VDGNPYAPPKTAVADVKSATDTGRPYEVTLAVRLQWFGVALGAVNGLVESARTVSTSALPIAAVVAIPVFTIGVLAWLTRNIARGRNWARITLLVMFVIGTPLFLWDLRAMFERSPVATAVSLIISALQIAALYLVFTGVGARWFRRGKGSSEGVA